MLKIKKIFYIFFVALNFSLTGVSVAQQAQYQKDSQIVSASSEQFAVCFKESIQTRTTSQCSMKFFSDIQVIPANDYGRPIAMKMVSAIHEASLKYDRQQIELQDLITQIMKIQTEFETELQDATNRVAEKNAANARYRQQMRQQALRDMNEAFKPPAFIPPPCNGGMLGANNNCR